VQDPDPTPYPLDHLVRHGAPDAPALVTRDGTLDYAGLDLAVGRLAAALLASGLAPGDRVASWLNKTREACLMPLATARAGLIHVPVNPALKRAQVAHILADSGARLLIAGQARADALRADDVPNDCTLWLEDEAHAAAGQGEALGPSGHDPDMLAAILYTSGSTGKPKGVMLSHANLWLGAVSVAHYLDLAPDDRTLCVLPLSFDYGQNQLLSTWCAGGCAIPLDYLVARDVVKAVGRHDVTTLAGVPPLWVQLVETEWDGVTRAKLRRLTNSGGALTALLTRKLRALFPDAALYPMYGLTEAFRSTYLPPDLVDAYPGSIGRAVPFAEILVVGPDGVPARQGELVHAGPLVAQGYWNDAERTALRFKPAPAASRHGGTAVWSGDTVRRDADGLLYFVGRDDEMIKTSGNRVSPAEIEEVAVASGLAAEAVALGVPDERLGQAIILAVRGEPDEEGLRAYLRAELPAFMQPVEIVWTSQFPRNPNGKLDRVAIRDALLHPRKAA
jgi:acyl-CoA ligase (AMP-forming) (exosortase A-associated)